MSENNENDLKASTEENKEKIFISRAIAFIIDNVILLILLGVFHYIWHLIPLLGRWQSLEMFFSSFLGVIYILSRDNLFDGQSIGKKIMGLQVVSKDSGEVIGFNASVMRNLDLALPGIFICVLKLIPVVFLGFFKTLVGLFSVIISLVGLGIVLFEAWFLYTNGERVGDKLARTEVIKLEG